MEVIETQPSSSQVQPVAGASLLFRSSREKTMKGPLKLKSCLDSQAAEHLGEELTQYRGTPLTVDASEVSFLGALSLQMLLAARRQWNEDGKAFDFSPVSEHFVSGAKLLGVAPDDLGIISEVVQ